MATIEAIENLTDDVRRGSATHAGIQSGMKAMLRNAQAKAGVPGRFSAAVLAEPGAVSLIVGNKLDQTVALTSAVTNELRQARLEMKAIQAETTEIAEVILPAMMEYVSKLRSARMAVTSEMAQSLAALKDVRKFFLEEDHAAEVARLERFVSLCQAMIDLKKNGVLDAVCDSALRLAVNEK